jgi:hypothetical protein
MKQRYHISLSLFFGLFFAAFPLFSQGLSVQFEGDTVYACAGEPFSLRPTVSGGQPPYTYVWSDGSAADSLLLFPLSGNFTYTLTVIDSTGASAQDLVVVVPLPECVFPGDANGDRVSDMRDLLSVGRSFGSQGPIRPNAHSQWVGQAAPAWGVAFNSGIDYVHADADGDGLVANGDVGVIDVNYSGPQDTGLSLVDQVQGVSMGISFPTGNYGIGDTLVGTVWIGSDPQTLDSAYGVAFSVQYDQFLITPGSLVVDYSQSDMGQTGQDLVTQDHVFEAAGQVDIGLTRINHVARKAYGRVAEIIVVIDDITGKGAGIEMLTLALDHITLLDQHGNPLMVSPVSTEIPIELDSRTSTLVTPATQAIIVFPQPANQQLNVSWPGSWPKLDLRMTDMQGRVFFTRTLHGGQASLDVHSLPSGVYLLHLQGAQSSETRKIIIR